MTVIRGHYFYLLNITIVSYVTLQTKQVFAQRLTKHIFFWLPATSPIIWLKEIT